jgi:DNA sulfur modification protein DndD
VEIAFKYDNKNYLMKRVFIPKTKKPSIITLDCNGREISGNEKIEEALNELIPPNFADFFMFDGEQLSKFMTAQSEVSYRDSIHQLLGLKQIKRLKDSLGILRTRYSTKLTQTKSTSREVEVYQKQIESHMRQIDLFNSSIKDWEKDIKTKEEMREKFESHRKRYTNLPKVMGDIEKISKELFEQQGKENKIKLEIEKNGKNLFLEFIKSDLEKYTKDNIKQIETLTKTTGFNDKALELLHSRQKMLKKSAPLCEICGHKLSKNEKTKMREEIAGIKISLKDLEKIKEGRDLLKNEENIMIDFLNLLKGTNFQKNFDDLAEIKINCDKLDKRKENLTKESLNSKYGELSKINTQISGLDFEISKLQSDIDRTTGTIGLLEAKQLEITQSIQRLGHDDAIAQRTANMATYTSVIIEKLNLILENATRMKRDNILEEANKVFIQITNKPDEYEGLVFENEDSFAFKIMTKDKQVVINPSKGEKQVLAMSFLFGLNQYTGRQNPILMDTPVQSLDDVHSAQLGSALSKLSNQIIFLAQPKELAGEIYQNMIPAVAKEFTIRREDYKSIIEEKKNE